MSNDASRRSSRGLRIGAMLLTALLAGSGASSAEPDRGGPGIDSGIESPTIRIANMQFAPAELVVKRGSRVVWINEDLFPHTATAGESFDSAAIAAGASWTYVANQPGTYEYVCALHPTMKGRLVVQ